MFLFIKLTNAQTINTISKNVRMNDTVVIRLDDYTGEIQWQKSTDNINWTNLADAFADTLFIIANQGSLFRASVTAGNCAPFFSDVVSIQIVDVGLPGPQWLRNAVIVELPVLGFSMENVNEISGYGQGTYKGITKNLDFLKSLGVNVLCLYSVYNFVDATSLYIYRLDETNPTCGTFDDVKELCREAHKRDMYVISNTNYYGVHKSSPLINEHPEWFMDEELFDQQKFNFNNPDAFDYVVNSHVMWCVDAGLDGYRIDCGTIIYEKKVFDEIIGQCDANGKRILLAPEQVHLPGHIQGAGHLRANVIYDMTKPVAAEQGSVCSIVTEGTIQDPYRAVDWSSHNTGAQYDREGRYCAVNLENNQADCGREGAYKIRGSRFLYGFNMLFGIHVPWFMVGEAFSATHLMVPNYTDGFWSKMLHTYIDWTDTVTQKTIIDDFRKIAQIRADNEDLFHADQAENHIINVSCITDIETNAIPYARYIPGEKAVIVVGNDNTEYAIEFELHIPLAEMGFESNDSLMITDLWNNNLQIMGKSELSKYWITIPKDFAPGGGVRVLKVEPVL